MDVPAASSCFNCPAGRFSLTGQSTCYACSIGYFRPSNTSLACGKCDYGYYGDTLGATACKECQSGYVQPARGASTCIACGLGKFTASNRSTDCLPCSSGTYQNITAASICRECLAGSYQLLSGQTTCIPCDAGKISITSRAVSCSLCDPGYFNSYSGMTQCSLCVGGYYSSTFGSTICDSCGLGTYSILPGSSSCSQCPPGQFSNGTASTICQSCMEGQYQPTFGATNCTKCLQGTFAPIPLQSTCLACTPGKFNNDLGSSSCSLCPVGKSTQYFGSTSCTPCGAGRYAAVNGSASCTPCEEGYYTTLSGQTTCVACDGGTYQPQQGSTSCVLCSPGFFSGNGSSICKRCPAGTIASNNGTAICTACDGYSQPNFLSIACECKAGYYNDESGIVGEMCKPCPDGAFCDNPGVSYSNLETDNGYWRANTDTLQFYRCDYSHQCLGGRGSVCMDYRNGPICATCEANYYSYFGGNCVPCPSSKGSFVYMVLMAILGLFIFAVLNYILLRSVSHLMAEEEEFQMRKQIIKYGSNNSALLGQQYAAQYDQSKQDMENDDPNQSVTQDGQTTTDQPYFDVVDNVNYIHDHQEMETVRLVNGVPQYPDVLSFKIKILIGFLQVLSNIGVSLEVPWPKGYKSFISFFSVLNFDIIQAANVECVVEPGQVYYKKFVTIMLLPILLVSFIILFYYIPKVLWNTFGTRNLPREVIDGDVTSHVDVSAIRKLARRRTFRKAMKMILFILFLLYPLVSSTVLRLYVCKDINGTSYLRADYNTICYTEQWYSYATVGYAGIALYPVGIPMLTLFLLYRNRKQLRRPGVRAELGFLYDPYDTSKWWFELVDSLHKLTMTSLLSFIADKQLAAGLGFACIYLIVLSLMRPYKRMSDDLLHLLVQIELILIIYAGLVLTRETVGKSQDIFLSAVLIGLTVFIVGFGLYASLVAVKGMFIRWWYRRQGKDVPLNKKKTITNRLIQENEEDEAKYNLDTLQVSKPAVDIRTAISAHSGRDFSLSVTGRSASRSLAQKDVLNPLFDTHSFHEEREEDLPLPPVAEE